MSQEPRSKGRASTPGRDDVERALAELLARARDPRALAPRAFETTTLEKAVERVRARFLGAAEPVLTVALAGGTGVGKSTLVNALASEAIAESSQARPTTTRIRVYHHRDLPDGGLPQELGADALFVAHERAELRDKVVVDTPDLDSFVIGHRALTQRLLKAAGLVLYVFSPEKYLEERTWSVLREEHHFSACVAVINKADRVPRHELEKLTEDLRSRFASIGLPDVKIFRICARRHVPGAGAEESAAPDCGIDETDELRALIERELREGELARLIRGQRERAVGNLRSAVDAIAPRDLAGRLDAIEQGVEARAESAAARVAETIGPRLDAVEAELVPLATIRQHEAFRGPLRTWFSVADFLRYGLTGLVQRLLGGTGGGDRGAIGRIVGRSTGRAFEDALVRESRSVQKELYERSLPVGRWSEISGRTKGESLAPEIADEIETRFDVRAVAQSGRTGAVAWAGSAIGLMVPVGLIGYAMYLMASDFLGGQYTALMLLGQLIGVLVLFFGILHAGVSMLLPSTRGVGRGLGRKAVREVLTRTIARWLVAYRREVEDDVVTIREPLTMLESAATNGMSDSPKNGEGDVDVEDDRDARRDAKDAPGPPSLARAEGAGEGTPQTSVETSKSAPGAAREGTPRGPLAARLEEAAARKRPSRTK